MFAARVSPAQNELRYKKNMEIKMKINVNEVLLLDIPARDRMRIVLRSDALSHNEKLECLCRIVEQQAFDAVRRGGCNLDRRSKAAITAVRKFARGEIDLEKIKKAEADAALAAAKAKANERPRVLFSAAWAAKWVLAAAIEAGENAERAATWAADAGIRAAARVLTAEDWSEVAWGKQIEIVRSFVQESRF